ncbi:hypothetical protein MKK55_05310 [Methylobacterium sp. J-059]|uniref:hypothetical protein n=1 Tax=Methylobacterium sp. J-059 TaxID=2836643 RepID=UPI001FB9D5CF|nr:hypothetical protein [Methylobacterium sp. J-059]MCJ2038377.1 hypothetical protein [Methylobacterium sp. J-059]
MTPPRQAEARHLLEVVRTLAVPIRTERSIKLTPGALLADRFLVSLSVPDLGHGTSLEQAAVALRLAPAGWMALADRMPDADAVHLGYERGREGCVYKLYLEFSGAARRAFNGTCEPVLVHRAVKWDPANPPTFSIADYRWPGARSAPAIAARIAGMFPDAPGGPAATLGRGILGDLAGLPAPMLLEVGEAGNPRRSFDLNLYESGLTVGSCAARLAEAAAALAVAREASAAFPSLALAKLGHIAGGIGRDGRDFVTVYYGGTP